LSCTPAQERNAPSTADPAGAPRPRLLVYTHVFPNSVQPQMGVFVRERMFRVARELPLVVVAPVPWFPFQGLIRRFRPGFRPEPPRLEIQGGIEVLHPRFLSVPGAFKFLDGLFEGLGSLPTLLRLRQRFGFDLIDAHFSYPDGVAAMVVARLLGLPYTVTLRGPITRIRKTRMRRVQTRIALSGAARVFSVADSLRRDAIAIGVAPDQVQVVANGVDLDKFHPEPREACRRKLGLPADARILISVGGLAERKGFHRVIETLPRLIERHQDLHLIIAGGDNPEGHWEQRLRRQVSEARLQDRVHFLGVVPPDRLREVYAAGDVFVLATRFEGWANVFLEASACGLPIVTTDVGGNREVVSSAQIGILVPYGDSAALAGALDEALSRDWDRQAILGHARANAWQTRIPLLVEVFQRLHRAALE